MYPERYYNERERLSRVYELVQAGDLEHLTDDVWGGLFSEGERAILLEVMLNGPVTTTQIVSELGGYVKAIPTYISNLTKGGFLRRDRTVYPWRYSYDAKALATIPAGIKVQNGYCQTRWPEKPLGQRTIPSQIELAGVTEIKRVCPKCGIVLIVKWGRFYCPKCMEIVAQSQVKEITQQGVPWV